MLAGYGRHLNDNVRTAHLKCSSCKTRVHLSTIETDAEGFEVRSFACLNCAAISTIRLRKPGSDITPVDVLRNLDAC
jgi:hypothetical protein